MNWQDFLSHPIIQIVIVVGLAWVLYRISGSIITAIVRRIMSKHQFELKSDRRKQEDTVAGIIKTTAALLIWLIAAGAIIHILGFNLAQIAAGAGFLGIIIGLGAQTTIRDYLAGIFILLENQYRVGDIVTLNGAGVSQETSGVVEDISLRITKLRDLDGTLHIIRNGEASIITNRTFKYSSVVIDVELTYDTDIDKVEKLMNQIGTDMLKDERIGKDIREPIQFFRVDDFTSSSVIVKVVGRVSPASQWDVAGEYRRALLKEFKKQNIAIGYPQIVVRTEAATEKNPAKNSGHVVK